MKRAWHLFLMMLLVPFVARAAWDGQGNHLPERYPEYTWTYYGLPEDLFWSLPLDWGNRIGSRAEAESWHLYVPPWDSSQKSMPTPPLWLNAADLFLLGPDYCSPAFTASGKTIRFRPVSYPWWSEYLLHRDFYFRRDNLRSSDSKQSINGTEKKVIILIHGWNPGASKKPYDSADWKNLIKAINASIAGTDWKLLVYDWGYDAATGNMLPNDWSRFTWDFCYGDFLRDPYECASRAVEIAHLHGIHLGRLLEWRFPHLQQVHFIAHSAGAWAARSAVQKNNWRAGSLLMEVTLLDPFIPNGPYESTLLNAANFADGFAPSWSDEYSAVDLTDWFFNFSTFMNVPVDLYYDVIPDRQMWRALYHSFETGGTCFDPLFLEWGIYIKPNMDFAWYLNAAFNPYNFLKQVKGLTAYAGHFFPIKWYTASVYMPMEPVCYWPNDSSIPLGAPFDFQWDVYSWSGGWNLSTFACDTTLGYPGERFNRQWNNALIRVRDAVSGKSKYSFKATRKSSDPWSSGISCLRRRSCPVTMNGTCNWFVAPTRATHHGLDISQSLGNLATAQHSTLSRMGRMANQLPMSGACRRMQNFSGSS